MKAFPLWTLIFTALLMTIATLAACNPTEAKAEPPNRMLIIEEFEQGSYHFKIWTDTETNVMYLQLGASGGLTVMLDADGNPLIYEEE